jgi:hypothetical protein
MYSRNRKEILKQSLPKIGIEMQKRKYLYIYDGLFIGTKGRGRLKSNLNGTYYANESGPPHAARDHILIVAQ